MLDKRTDKLLSYLAQICADGSYKVIEIADLLKAMRAGYKADETALDQILKFLKDNEMIDIKYRDENVYCVSVLPKGRTHMETGSKKNYYNVTLGSRLTVITILGSFVAAFAGAFLAGIIMGLVL